MTGSLRSTAYHAGRYCTEQELLPASPCCPICGFDGGRKAVLTIQHSPDVLLLECPSCRGISSSRMPTPETLLAYYANYRQDDDLKVTFFSPKRFAAHLLKIFGKRRWNEGSIRILDFGGGDGASSVIEHLPEPMPILTNLLGSLKVGGCFYARTPWIVPVPEDSGNFGGWL